MPRIVTSEFDLGRVVAPRLPSAPAEYERQYHEQYSNILRLYFNRLDAILGQLETQASTAAIQVPYGSFYQDGVSTLTANITNVSTAPISVSSTTGFAPSGSILIGRELINYTAKTATTLTGITRGVYGTTTSAHSAADAVTEALGVPSITTSQAVIFTGTFASFGMELSGAFTSRVVCSTAGVYNFQFSAQLFNFTTVEDNVTMWFRRNGVDIEYSAGVFQVNAKHGSSPGAAVATWNIIVDMGVADYLELVFSSITGNTVCASYPAGTAPVSPIAPSVLLTATFVSATPL